MLGKHFTNNNHKLNLKENDINLNQNPFLKIKYLIKNYKFKNK